MAVRILVFAVCAALASTGCSDDCGDGEYHDAEICFDKHVLEVRSEAASPLALRSGTSTATASTTSWSSAPPRAPSPPTCGSATATAASASRATSASPGAAPIRWSATSTSTAPPTSCSPPVTPACSSTGPTAPAASCLPSRSTWASRSAPPPSPTSTATAAATSSSSAACPNSQPSASSAPTPPAASSPIVHPVVVPGLDRLQPGGFVAGRLRRDGPVELILAEWERSDGLARATVEAGVLGPFVAMTTGLRPGGLYLRDLDDDDILDVLVLDTAPVALAPLLGPDLSEGPRTDLGSRPGPIALAHLDGDGSLDAVLFHGDRLGLWRGVGDGRFTAAVQLGFSADVAEAVLPDLNADGRADVVAGLFPEGGLAIRLSGP
ncbi:VCBS repeat-containing protein [Nannocystis pusilla]|uniref:VCBS repeat-containing protein n=2 Tax=Nannocystis pusilla TaxID=889268 RepID=A0A9X3EXY9_9BACT|nr:VCBS repeat-containing protein [Nannocystis pusilla]